MDIFKRKNKISKEEQVEQLISYIKEKTKKDSFGINILPEKTPSIFDSKLSGIPYWDLEKPFPLDSEGNNLSLLCQINFSEENVEGSILPQEGILQFFISTDDPYFGTSDDYNYTNNKGATILKMKVLIRKANALTYLLIAANLLMTQFYHLLQFNGL